MIQSQHALQQATSGFCWFDRCLKFLSQTEVNVKFDSTDSSAELFYQLTGLSITYTLSLRGVQCPALKSTSIFWVMKKMYNATSHRQERSTQTGLFPFVIVMNVLWNRYPLWQEPPQFLNCLMAFFIPLWNAVFAISVSNGTAKIYPELLRPMLNVQLSSQLWDLPTAAYSAGILSVLSLLMAKRTVRK